jgi:hypothetical protein
MIETEWSDMPIKDIPQEHVNEALSTDVSVHLRSMTSYLAGRGRLDEAGLDRMTDEAGDVLNNMVDADESSTPREAYGTTRALDLIMLGLLAKHTRDGILDGLPGDMGDRVRDYFTAVSEDSGE